MGSLTGHGFVKNRHARISRPLPLKMQDVYADGARHKRMETVYSSVSCCAGSLSFIGVVIQDFIPLWARDRFLDEFKFATDRRNDGLCIVDSSSKDFRIRLSASIMPQFQSITK
ncbi:MAG: hypothetical protein P0116_13725 [Candidatus Nitrosocosmicus sp.]|nr:hypothetical protein [Candidatus Nitrosocosmicus sp.]